MVLNVHYLQIIVMRGVMVWFIINCNDFWWMLSGAAVIATVSLHYCGFVNFTYVQVSEKLRLNIDHPDTMNMWVSYHTVCPLQNHWELVEMLDGGVINESWQLGMLWKAQCSLRWSLFKYKHYCCSTHCFPIEWSCWLKTHIVCINIFVMLIL